MKHFSYILAFLIGAPIMSMQGSKLKEERILKSLNTKVSVSTCGIFSNKRTFEDELVAHVLNLKCDSTFTFTTTACWCYKMSSGVWHVQNNIIYLKTDKNVLAKNRQKLKGRLRKMPCSNQWIDLTGTSIIEKDSFIVWKLTGNNPDTLYRE